MNSTLRSTFRSFLGRCMRHVLPAAGLGCVLIASPADACLDFIFHGNQITVSPTNPGGGGGGGSFTSEDTKARSAPKKAVIFGTGLTRDDGLTRQFKRLDVVSTDDFLGWSIVFPTDVPPASVWLALDLQTGCWAVDSPSGQANLVPFPTPPLFLPANPPPNAVQEIATVWAQADVMVWRPDGSLLSQQVFDGATADFDGTANGAVTIDAVALGAVEGTPSSRPVEAGDVVAVLNPQELTIAVKEVTATDAANGVISP